MNRVCSTYRAGAVFTVIIAGLLTAANARDFTPLAAGRPRPLVFDEYWDGEIARQKREVPLASGYCDSCCPSEGVYIAYANVKGEKLLTVDPLATYCRTKNTPFLEFLRGFVGN